MTEEEEIEEPIEMDGYIEIHAFDPSQDPPIHYRRFSFNDIGMIHVELWGLRITLNEQADGQQTIFMWSWPNILHVKHVTNSTEVADKLRSRDMSAYAQEGLDIIEQLANGVEFQEGGHIHQGEGENLKVAHGYETPCGHGQAVQAEDAPVWTCLTCAAQWKDDQWHVT